MKVDRREFLRKAGLGSIALASLPKFIDALAKPSFAQGKMRFFATVAFSTAGKVEGVEHYLVIAGEGFFDPESGQVEGGGNFAHQDNASTVTPKTLINVGRWRPTKILSYGKQVGTYARIEASILELQVNLLPDLGPTRKIEGATLRLICNIGAAGLTTGEPEGFVLTVPGAPVGPFRPLVPPLGLTHISIPGGF